jgi:hypothetical protein
VYFSYYVYLGMAVVDIVFASCGQVTDELLSIGCEKNGHQPRNNGGENASIYFILGGFCFHHRITTQFR